MLYDAPVLCVGQFICLSVCLLAYLFVLYVLYVLKLGKGGILGVHHKMPAPQLLLSCYCCCSRHSTGWLPCRFQTTIAGSGRRTYGLQMGTALHTCVV